MWIYLNEQLNKIKNPVEKKNYPIFFYYSTENKHVLLKTVKGLKIGKCIFQMYIHTDGEPIKMCLDSREKNEYKWHSVKGHTELKYQGNWL